MMWDGDPYRYPEALQLSDPKRAKGGIVDHHFVLLFLRWARSHGLSISLHELMLALFSRIITRRLQVLHQRGDFHPLTGGLLLRSHSAAVRSLYWRLIRRAEE